MLSPPDILLRLLLAALLGSVIGLDRQRLNWAAGLRTHMLVCVGATLFMMVSAFGFADSLPMAHVTLDPSRIAAQVVSGIGFLGAGSILVRGRMVHGITTAAGLWTVAAVGLAVGGGMYLAAACATGLILLILTAIKPLEARLANRQNARKVSVKLKRHKSSLAEVEAVVRKVQLELNQVVIELADEEQDWLRLTFRRAPSRDQLLDLLERLRKLEGVRKVQHVLMPEPS